MGLFLSMAGIIGAKEPEVIAALRDYSRTKPGILEENGAYEEGNMLLANQAGDNILLQFPDEFFAGEEACQEISSRLQKAVFFLHIHDDDLWMYTLFRNGVRIDGFNPIPDYWSDDISDEERAACKGNATVVCQCVPELSPRDIEGYLIPWDLDAEDEVKAYPDDKFPSGDFWQIVDFMRKIAIPYPDPESAIETHSYLFKIPS